MGDLDDSLLTATAEIIRLLRVIAEPSLAIEDKEPRAAIRKLVGRSSSKAQAVMLMDGSRTQSEIRQAVKIDSSDLSKLVKALRAEKLTSGEERPKLTLYVPPKLFDSEEGR